MLPKVNVWILDAFYGKLYMSMLLHNIYLESWETKAILMEYLDSTGIYIYKFTKAFIYQFPASS